MSKLKSVHAKLSDFPSTKHVQIPESVQKIILSYPTLSRGGRISVTSLVKWSKKRISPEMLESYLRYSAQLSRKRPDSVKEPGGNQKQIISDALLEKYIHAMIAQEILRSRMENGVRVVQLASSKLSEIPENVNQETLRHEKT